MAVNRKKIEPALSNEGFEKFLETSRHLAFEPHDIALALDDRGQYEVTLDREFPFLIKLFHYTSRKHTRGATWHSRLELFTTLDGPVRFRMGNRVLDLQRGDMLVVDNMKLHHVIDFPGFNTRAVVISFMPEFVFSLGSPSHDYAFLLPFYSRQETNPHVLTLRDAASSPVFSAMTRLVDCYFSTENSQYYQAGCKVFLLELLYNLARHFRTSEVLQWEFLRQQERSQRLKPLFEHLSRRYADKTSIEEAARFVHMSQPQFMKTFKKVSGMTFVNYVNHVRLSNAVRLIKQTSQSFAEIACAVGFSDQSYFDKRFKAAFAQTPKQFRESSSGAPNTDAPSK